MIDIQTNNLIKEAAAPGEFDRLRPLHTFVIALFQFISLFNQAHFEGVVRVHTCSFIVIILKSILNKMMRVTFEHGSCNAVVTGLIRMDGWIDSLNIISFSVYMHVYMCVYPRHPAL